MGTRADFYVGRGEDAEWIGSIAWDGYPEGIVPYLAETEMRFGTRSHKIGEWPEGEHLFDAQTEQAYRERVIRFFQYRKDVTLPSQGWPWPWETSHTTDFAYSFDTNKVWVSNFGGPWSDPRLPDVEPEPVVFPNMTQRQNVTFGERSGVIVIGRPE